MALEKCMQELSYEERLYVEVLWLKEDVREKGKVLFSELVKKPEEMRQRLAKVMDDCELSKRDRKILKLRFQNQESLRTIATRFSISAEFVRMEIARSLRKMRKTCYREFLLKGDQEEVFSKVTVETFRNRPIESLGLSIHSENSLKRAGYLTIEEVLAVFNDGIPGAIETLQRKRTVGLKVREELVESLSNAGLINSYGSVVLQDERLLRRSKSGVLRDLTLHEYHLPARALGALRHAVLWDLVTVGDLVDRFEPSITRGFTFLMQARGIGEKTRQDIYNVLVNDGFLPRRGEKIELSDDIFLLNMDISLNQKLDKGDVITVAELLNLYGDPARQKELRLTKKDCIVIHNTLLREGLIN